jgi:hypothetical protein
MSVIVAFWSSKLLDYSLSKAGMYLVDIIWLSLFNNYANYWFMTDIYVVSSESVCCCRFTIFASCEKSNAFITSIVSCMSCFSEVSSCFNSVSFCYCPFRYQKTSGLSLLENKSIQHTVLLINSSTYAVYAISQASDSSRFSTVSTTLFKVGDSLF